jgi:hypothetical protein
MYFKTNDNRFHSICSKRQRKLKVSNFNAYAFYLQIKIFFDYSYSQLLGSLVTLDLFEIVVFLD